MGLPTRENGAAFIRTDSAQIKVHHVDGLDTRIVAKAVTGNSSQRNDNDRNRKSKKELPLLKIA